MKNTFELNKKEYEELKDLISDTKKEDINEKRIKKINRFIRWMT